MDKHAFFGQNAENPPIFVQNHAKIPHVTEGRFFRYNKRTVPLLNGGDPEGKIVMLMDFTKRPGDVADPWYTGNFEATWRDVLEGCQALLDRLAKGCD